MSVRGPEAALLLHHALTSDVLALADGEAQPTHLFGAGLDTDAILQRETATQFYAASARTPAPSMRREPGCRPSPMATCSSTICMPS